LVITHYRYLQVIGLVLILIAGHLWTQRLGDQSWRNHAALLKEAENDQLDILEANIENKNDPLALVGLGQKLLDNGDAESAIIPLERATQIKSNYRDAWYLLGYSYIKADLDTQSEVAVTHPIAYRQQAKKALEKAHTIDPGHEPTNHLLKELSGK